MKKILLTLQIIIVLGLLFYAGMSYISTQTNSFFRVTLIEKYTQEDHFWVTFYDALEQKNINIEIEKTTWELLEVNSQYIISYKLNQLFRKPKLIDIEKVPK